MDITSLKEIAELGSSSVILIVFLLGLYFFYTNIIKYITSKDTENKEEKEYYRSKIDKKDEEMKVVISDFTEVLKGDVKGIKFDIQDLKGEFKKMNDKLERERR